jgi:hypothetical protein
MVGDASNIWYDKFDSWMMLLLFLASVASGYVPDIKPIFPSAEFTKWGIPDFWNFKNIVESSNNG